MNKVIACVDGAAHTLHVYSYATWAAQRMGAPLEFLHVLDRHPGHAPVTDYGGSIGLGTQESLLLELAALDEKRSTLAQQHGRELLDGLVQRAKGAGLDDVGSRQRHGSLVETLVEMESETRLLVLGQHHSAEPGVRLHLDHHVERTIRSVQRPVLVASTAYCEPQRVVIAFDGSPTGHKMIEAVAGSALLKGLRCDVVMAGDTTDEVTSQLAWAQSHLLAAGFEVKASVEAGHPETALPNYLKVHSADLLVMGAYGHSRIRQFIVGSTTTTLLRTSPVPVLVLR